MADAPRGQDTRRWRSGLILDFSFGEDASVGSNVGARSQETKGGARPTGLHVVFGHVPVDGILIILVYLFLFQDSDALCARIPVAAIPAERQKEIFQKRLSIREFFPGKYRLSADQDSVLMAP